MNPASLPALAGATRAFHARDYHGLVENLATLGRLPVGYVGGFLDLAVPHGYRRPSPFSGRPKYQEGVGAGRRFIARERHTRRRLIGAGIVEVTS